jgi:hypothetical protein
MMADLTVVDGGKSVGAEVVSIEHADTRNRILDLRRQVEEGYWDLSQALYEVYSGSYYIAWGFASWKEYAECELELAPRKAQYLVSIQEWFGRMRPEIQNWVQGLGWTKAKELVGVVTEENAKDWRNRLDGLSYRDMMSELHRSDDGSGPNPDPLPSGTSNSSGDEKPQKKMFSLFSAQSENVEVAIEKAKKMANTEKEGHALDLICSDFLATNAGVDTVSEMLGRFERSTGLYLIAYDKNDDCIVYGSEILDEIASEED